MPKWLLRVMFGIVLAVGTSNAALAGEPVDPNLHDTVLGKVAGVRYASDTAAYNPGNSGYAATTAGCGKPGWHLIGGGAASGGPASQGWLAADRPDDYIDLDLEPDDGFLVGGFGPGGAEITAYAVCLRDADLRYRRKQIADQPTVLRSGSVGCGGARWRVASGSAFIATSNSWVHSSFPLDGGDAGTSPDDGWRGTAYDTVGGFGGFYVYAVCAKGLELHYVQGVSGDVAAGQAIWLKARCGRNGHVVGGGVRVSGPADAARLVTSAPFDGPDAGAVPDDGWRARVYNLGGSDKQVTPFAICLT